MRTETQAREIVSRLKQEILADLGGELLSPDELFLGNMTLGKYLVLSDKEKSTFWEAWSDMDLVKLEKREVSPDALPAR